jgi:hypothetical protein
MYTTFTNNPPIPIIFYVHNFYKLVQRKEDDLRMRNNDLEACTAMQDIDNNGKEWT